MKMLTFIYDSKNGMVLPDARWEEYIANLITQFNASDKDITVTLGASLPFDIVTNYVGSGAIYYKQVQLVNVELCKNILEEYDFCPVDSDGYALKHMMIGNIHQEVLMRLM